MTLCGKDVTVVVLKEGYAFTSEKGEQKADGTISLVRGPGGCTLVDTGGPWDKQFLIDELQRHGLKADDIDHVVGTHGHSDHIGNLNLFPNATCIVSFDVCKGDTYIDNNLGKGEELTLTPQVSVMPTPGHTGSDVSVVIRDHTLGTVVVAGDLFECEEDLADSSIWEANSENVTIQRKNRQKVLEMADYIIPGHGKMFRVSMQ